MLVWVLAVAALCLAGLPAFGQQSGVKTSLGVLNGKTLTSLSGRPFYGFEGVPYAKPPIGKHRFKESIPGTPWPGVLNATRLPPACVQLANPMLFGNTTQDVAGSEDCLYMNIYTPKLPTDGKLLDVIFYIHGGAFQHLSGSMWGPDHILDHDVVFVNFNYRLGVLGFLSLGDGTLPGNNGLKDQTLALKWVNKHIAAFGGNPNKITIVGCSAGSASVHYHLLSPLSKGLFHKAIANSGSALNPWTFTKKPREKALIIAESVGCPTDDSTRIVECLRARNAEQLVASVRILAEWATYPISSIGPVIEQPSANAFIDQYPIDLIKAKAINDVPILFSHTSDEGASFALGALSDPKNIMTLETKWNELLPHIHEFQETADPTKLTEISQAIRKEYMGEENIMSGIHGFVKSLSDRYFVNGIQQAAMLHAEHQSSPVYAYKFSYAGESKFNPLLDRMRTVYKGGAVHGLDHLHALSTKLVLPIQMFPESLAMTKTLIGYWMKFIDESPVSSWSTVNSGLPNFTVLDIVGPEDEKNVFKSETPSGVKFWEKFNLQENTVEKIQPNRSNLRKEL